LGSGQPYAGRVRRYDFRIQFFPPTAERQPVSPGVASPPWYRAPHPTPSPRPGSPGPAAGSLRPPSAARQTACPIAPT